MKILLFISVFILANSQDKFIPNKSKTLITKGEIHSNNVKAILANNGWLFWGGGASGFITPSPVFENNPGNFATIFMSGMWFVGRVNGELKAAIANYSTDFIPGNWDDYQNDPIANGRDNPENIIYYHYSDKHLSYLESLLSKGRSELEKRINSFALSELEKAQLHQSLWLKAIAQGAPENPPGDIAAYTIYHDADIPHRENNGNNKDKAPLNIQVRQLVFSFRAENAVNNAIYVKIEVINKNSSPIEDFHTAFYSDPDVGQYHDDLVGSDPELQLGYAYNGDDSDAQYTEVLKIPPPAVGVKLLQGYLIDSIGHQVYKLSGAADIYVNEAKNLSSYDNIEIIQDKYVQKMSGVFYFNSGDEADGAQEYYHNLNNRFATTGQLSYQQQIALAAGLADSLSVNWIYNGDPLNGSGWLDTYPNDRRLISNLSKTTLGISNALENFDDPGYNQLYFAVFSSFGKSNLHSVAQLKFDAYDVQAKYNLAFNYFELKNPAPLMTYNSSDTLIRLLWNSQSIDELSTEQNVKNGYSFEGYQIVQFKDESKTEFKVIEIQDIANDIRNIYNNAPSRISSELVPELTIRAKNKGINYFTDIEKDFYTNKPLRTHKKYYYGIRAYYHHPEAPDRKSFAKFGEWAETDEFYITKKIELGTEKFSEFGQYISYEQSHGITDASVKISVFNPYEVTGKNYTINFKEFPENTYFLGYPNDTIAAHSLGWYLEKEGSQVSKLFPPSKTGEEFNYALFYDGLKIIVSDVPLDFKSFTVVANAYGTLEPAEMGAFAFNSSGFPIVDGHVSPDGSRQQSNGSTWGIHISNDWMSDPSNASYTNFVNDLSYYMGGIDHEDALAPALAGGNGIHHASPNDYEIRFTANGSRALLKDSVNRFIVDIPFELWNLGPDPNDYSDDYKMVAFIRDRDGNQEWNILPEDHSLSGGINDPHSEGITFLDPSDKSSGTSGYEAILAAAHSDLSNNWENTLSIHPNMYNSSFHTVSFNSISFVNWNGGDVDDENFPANLDASSPETGTIFRISMNKINTKSTVLSFKAPDAPILHDRKLAKSQFKENLTVFPNPFYKAQSDQKNVYDRYVTFANLPALEQNEFVEIKIYSINGNLIKTIKYTGKSTLQRWELENNAKEKIKSGLYIAVLKYGNVSVIKKILIFV